MVIRLDRRLNPRLRDARPSVAKGYGGRALKVWWSGVHHSSLWGRPVGRGPVPRRPENPKDGAIQVHPPSAAPEATRVRALQKNLRNLLSELCDKGWLFTREMLAKTRFSVRDAATHQYAFEKLEEAGVGTRQVPGVGTSVPTFWAWAGKL